MTIPASLTDATTQAMAATQAALQDGYDRLQVEMVIPELKHQPIAAQFLDCFADQQLKVFFPDAGAAALARRDWGNPDFTVRGIGEMQTPVEPDDEIFLVVNPSSVEVEKVEAMCNEATGRPVVLLNPQLEDVAVVGIGYAARQIRDRFLSRLTSCYYLKPVDGAAIYRCYPGPWQIWRETAPNEYEWVRDYAQKPSSEDLDQVLLGDSPSESEDSPESPSQKRKKGIFSELQQFLKALSQ